jgi:cytochrome c551/c552
MIILVRCANDELRTMGCGETTSGSGRSAKEKAPMREAGAAVVLATTLAAMAFNAEAQDGDIAMGHAFAREACKACHIVEAEESSPRRFEIGPAFRDIANTPGMKATAIRVFLTSSHPFLARSTR